MKAQKKLLVLGGLRYVLPVIHAAHDLGAYVITADYLPNNFAHKCSDEYVNISIIDKEKTLKAAQEKKVDGIISFACDPGVTTAAYVAEKMGLPSVGSYEAVSILQNKKRFRQFLLEHHFNVPTAIGYTDAKDAMKDVNLFHWPVIVKPTDSAGSKGVKRVDDPKDLSSAIDDAIQFSISKECIVEDYLEQVGFSSDTDCFSVNGELKFVSFNSQMFDQNAENPYTPAAFSWPSSMQEKHQKELTKEIQRLISLLHLGTSIYNIETRECIDGKAYIMECSPRGGGNRLAECLEYATGIKLIENAVRAALGMEPNGIEQKDYIGNFAEIVLHGDHGGVFEDLWINENISKNIVEKDLWVKSGERIGGFRAANESIGTIIMKFDTQEQMKEVLDHQKEYIVVRMRE